MKAVQILALSLAGIPMAHCQSVRQLPFQARLVDSVGKALPDGTAVVQFQIFNQPSGGAPVWAGEVHRVTVNGGLVNVSLGAKNPFPLDRANEFGAVVGSFFDQSLYLEVRVDTAGVAGTAADGHITGDDPPLLPRQSIQAPPFAAEAAFARSAANAERLGSRPANEVVNATVPVGGIVPFYGNLASLTASWRVCDGSVVQDPDSRFNGQPIPDLRDTFLRGASTFSPLGERGGQDFVNDHSHFFSDSASVFVPRDGGMNGWTGAQSVATRATEFSPTYYALTIRKGVANADQTSHGHTGTANVSGFTVGGGSHDNRPSYFAIHYIIRIK